MRTWPWLAIATLLLPSLPLRAQEPPVPDSRWEVARAQFTSGIKDREPVDRLLVASPLVHEVYFFTDLRHLEGRTVTHRWKYEGKVVSQVPFKVGGPRWRVNSRKDIEPDQVGEWSVTVVDQSGWPLYTELFRYENGAPVLQPSEGEQQATGSDKGQQGQVIEGSSPVPSAPGEETSPAAAGSPAPLSGASE